MTLLQGLGREQVKRYFVQAAEIGNFQMAKLMMSYLEQLIDIEGFIDTDEIREYYLVKHWLEESII
jgi:hypothetical protein